ncbi:MAG: DUF3667 domain-containing protein [Bacteroidia bacterium]|nr:DUF3667 domain-containing protein [Bacteroidia bacterium]
MNDALAPVQSPETRLLCANCGKKIKEKHKFCPSCGQSTRLRRISIRDVLDMAIQKVLHADSTLMQLIIGLTLRPGTMIRDYMHGKRKKVYSPIKFLFYAAGISVFVTEYFRLFELVPGGGNPVSALAQRYNNLLVLAGVPVSGLFSWLFFRKREFNFSEHLVFHAFLAGYRAFFFLLILTPLMVLAPAYFGVITAVYLLCFLAYASWATIGFLGGPAWLTILKTVLTYFLTQLAVGLLITAIVIMQARMHAGG